MGNKITVITQPGNRISINTPQKQQIKSVNVVGATSVGTGGVTRLEQLRDVDTSQATNNETLVYDEASGKYIVKELPIINGGTF
jgi:hypothetical protein